MSTALDRRRPDPWEPAEGPTPQDHAPDDASDGPAPWRPRRRPPGPSFGPLPLVCVVVVELGLAAAVVLLVVDRALLPLAGVALSAGLLVGLLRVRGRWLVQWLGLALRFRARPRTREAPPRTAGDPGDARLRLLHLLTGDVSLAGRRDHDGREVGLVGHEGAWSAVLAPSDAATPLVADTAADTTFPLAALAAALTDRGVVLDAVGALWHQRPAGAGLDPDAPAVTAYREVLGPLPAVARRAAWLVVRLDPARCPEAVAERGGGVVGAQRALLGALARLRRVLADHGVPVRPLDTDEVVRAAAEAAVLTGSGQGDPTVTERWDAVVAGAPGSEVGHASWAVTGWSAGPPGDLAALLDTAATAGTLAITLSPGVEPGEVGLHATVRLSARTPDELDAAGAALVATAAASGLRLDRLDGQQAAAVVATLPWGTAP